MRLLGGNETAAKRLAGLPRARITHLPTPVVELRRLAAFLGGPRLFMKRDDLTGLALGGNKTRKLEFLLGEALDRGCDTVITGGAMQSNHSRQTAAAAAAVGLECHLALGGEPPPVAEGNLLLDYLFGATVHWCGALEKGERIPEIADELRSRGRRPYVIPFGGSNAVGAMGFAAAMGELAAQMSALGARITHIVLPSSSGGTQAGMALGADIFGLDIDIVGIGIDRGEAGTPPYETELAALANEAAGLLGAAPHYTDRSFQMKYGYLGGGYAVVGDIEREATLLTGSREGILLDPVYTARAMGALIDMAHKGELTSRDSVLFWHTGGLPAVFVHSRDLVRE
jgi:D-cysteine desulfhydrase family pyridoxal phosphate-dependent enzyme